MSLILDKNVEAMVIVTQTKDALDINFPLILQ
jgi:hypothetical protein